MQAVAVAIAIGSLIWRIVQSSLYLVGGWIVFKWCERIAKRRGGLGQS